MMIAKHTSKPVRVRFAPSPTGPLNIGGARTALFNWLFARHEGGAFVLRIEDTDAVRSKREYEENIKESLAWLGLSWDEFHRQTDRTDRYAEGLERLLDEDKAYFCFCTPEELERERETQLSQGLPPVYGGRCRAIPKEERARRAGAEKGVIRLKVPEKRVSFADIVRGEVSFDTKLIGDFIIAKGTREPLYNFAAAVDDFEMGISHVIRGEEHISNTPRQMLIQEALGLDEVTYAHLPLILRPDRKKLSKRDLAKSLLDYRTEGYLPAALVNFLALLGWHPREDREVFSLEDLAKEFSLDRAQKAGAIFNPEKLEWLNGLYIRNMSDAALAEALRPLVPEGWSASPDGRFEKAIALEKERMKTLLDFKQHAALFFALPEYEGKLLSWKGTPLADVQGTLAALRDALAAVPDAGFTGETVAAAVAPITERAGRGQALWPLRVALSGQAASPGPFEIAVALGKAESLRRIAVALEKTEPSRS